jgi:3-hydroxyacyl-CoA dehydrogenase
LDFHHERFWKTAVAKEHLTVLEFLVFKVYSIWLRDGLTIEEVDKLTGPVIGRPKSATFRTVDVVGLDTLVHVANGIYENCRERRVNYSNYQGQ